MTLEKLIEHLSKLYEDNSCDENIRITLSTYGCGAVTVTPLPESRIQVKTSDTGEISINIDAEDY